MPYTVYTTGIGYRNDLVDDPAQLDNPYDIFWNADYAGQTHLLNGARDTIAAALLRMDADINTEDPAVLDQAKQMLLDGVSIDELEVRPRRLQRARHPFEVHMTWSGQVTYYQYYLPKGQHDRRSTATSWPPKTPPDLQGILTNDVFAIPKGAKNPVLAHSMIDLLLDRSTPSRTTATRGSSRRIRRTVRQRESRRGRHRAGEPREHPAHRGRLPLAQRQVRELGALARGESALAADLQEVTGGV